MYITRVKADGTTVDLANAFVDNFERTLNEGFEATPREEAEYYMSRHIARDRKRGLLGFNVRRHAYSHI
jgi:hypothetical protein